MKGISDLLQHMKVIFKYSVDRLIVSSSNHLQEDVEWYGV